MTLVLCLSLTWEASLMGHRGNLTRYPLLDIVFLELDRRYTTMGWVTILSLLPVENMLVGETLPLQEGGGAVSPR
jgi:hypothetical protein